MISFTNIQSSFWVDALLKYDSIEHKNIEFKLTPIKNGNELNIIVDVYIVFTDYLTKTKYVIGCSQFVYNTNIFLTTDPKFIYEMIKDAIKKLKDKTPGEHYLSPSAESSMSYIECFLHEVYLIQNP